MSNNIHWTAKLEALLTNVVEIPNDIQWTTLDDLIAVDDWDDEITQEYEVIHLYK